MQLLRKALASSNGTIPSMPERLYGTFDFKQVATRNSFMIFFSLYILFSCTIHTAHILQLWLPWWPYYLYLCPYLFLDGRTVIRYMLMFVCTKSLCLSLCWQYCYLSLCIVIQWSSYLSLAVFFFIYRTVFAWMTVRYSFPNSLMTVWYSGFVYVLPIWPLFKTPPYSSSCKTVQSNSIPYLAWVMREMREM